MPTRPQADLGSIHDDAYRVAEAKRRLLDWGVQADEDLKRQIAELRDTVTSGARKARPWGLGLAAGAGLIGALFLRRGKRRGGRGEGAANKGGGGGFGLPIGQIVGIVRVLAPIVLPMLLKPRARD